MGPKSKRFQNQKSVAFLSPSRFDYMLQSPITTRICKRELLVKPPLIHFPSPNSCFYRSLHSDLGASVFEVGDTVEFTDSEGSNVIGKVIERRGGWYSIEGTDTSNNKVYKKRGKQMKRKLGPIENGGKNEDMYKTASKNSDLTQMPPPPTMVDLDSLLHTDSDLSISRDKKAIVSQAEYISSNFNKWVMFTDLHCSPSTLSTTLKILDKVHEIAQNQPNTGVLFLGDFWHHRGSLPIPTLNAVLDSLSKWKVPMIMIPGNHDQVTFRGEEHGLSPLRNAYQLCTENSSNLNIPGPLIFSQPTQFLNATFIPHIRDNGMMESILSSSLATSPSTKALFVHADVTGAYMNDLIRSEGGVPPRMFPRNKLIYSGHFHKPHSITWKGGSKKSNGKSKNDLVEIVYVGSPYEISLSEAGQEKALQILDSCKGWECIERLPLNIGPKHYKCSNIPELMKIGPNLTGDVVENAVKEGDRVVMSVTDFELERHSSNRQVEDKVQQLRKLGVKVEIRTVKHTKSDENEHSSIEVEDMTPESTLRAFLEAELRSESLTKERSVELQSYGLDLIKELSSKSNTSATETDLKPSIQKEFRSNLPSLTDLKLTSVTVQGFGCFQKTTEYPLDERGLVLIRGINADGGSDSNGSGKSTLAMSTLWALTGSMDPRPVQDGKVSDVVNDNSKVTKVTLRGYINAEPFAITRTKTSTNKSSLTFLLNQEDLTQQSVKETQILVNERICSGASSSQILSRIMFHGQHALNGLLEATDVQWKEELALVVPLDLWKDGSSLARKKSRLFKSNVSEYKGMISIREKDLYALKQRYKDAEGEKKERHHNFLTRKKTVESELENLFDDVNASWSYDDLLDNQRNLEDLSSAVATLEKEKREIMLEKEDVLAPLQMRLEKAEAAVFDERKGMEWKLLEIEQGKIKLTNAENVLSNIEKKWNQVIGNGKSIDKCPTCNRPLEEGDHHHHTEEILQKSKDAENKAALQEFMDAKSLLKFLKSEHELKQNVLLENEIAYEEVSQRFKKEWETWDSRISSLDSEIHQARELQTEKATFVSKIVSQLNKMSQLQSRKSDYESELQRLQDAYHSSMETFTSVSMEFEKIKRQVEDLKDDRDSAQQKSNIYSQLADIFGPRGVQTFVLKDAIKSLELSSQIYLDELSEKSQRLELALDKSDRLMRKTYIRLPNGSFQERPLSSLSGGQWRRCSLALAFGFSELVARRGGLMTSLLVLDEPLTHLDSSGRERVGALLRRMVKGKEGLFGLKFSTILVILQDLAAEELGEESFDFVDVVSKSNGESAVKLDDGFR